jgi:hypothetical protein
MFKRYGACAGLVACAALMLVGCDDDNRSVPERAGDETKGAMEKTGDGLEKAADKTGDAAQKTGDAIHDKTN